MNVHNLWWQLLRSMFNVQMFNVEHWTSNGRKLYDEHPQSLMTAVTFDVQCSKLNAWRLNVERTETIRLRSTFNVEHYTSNGRKLYDERRTSTISDHSWYIWRSMFKCSMLNIERWTEGNFMMNVERPQSLMTAVTFNIQCSTLNIERCCTRLRFYLL